MVCMNHPKPLKLIVKEPSPGSFFWVLVHTGADGADKQEIKSSHEPADTYEAALAAGTRALNAMIRQRDAQAHTA
jgi:hypothetical protein